VSDEESVACACQGACEHTLELSEVVLPPLRPRSVGMHPMDRQGLVEMAYRRGVVIPFPARRER
jgi:hypothetical protein